MSMHAFALKALEFVARWCPTKKDIDERRAAAHELMELLPQLAAIYASGVQASLSVRRPYRSYEEAVNGPGEPELSPALLEFVRTSGFRKLNVDVQSSVQRLMRRHNEVISRIAKLDAYGRDPEGDTETYEKLSQGAFDVGFSEAALACAELTREVAEKELGGKAWTAEDQAWVQQYIALYEEAKGVNSDAA